MTPLQLENQGPRAISTWRGQIDLQAEAEPDMPNEEQLDLEQRLWNYLDRVIALEDAVQIPVAATEREQVQAKATPLTIELVDEGEAAAQRGTKAHREWLLGMAYASRESLETRINAAHYLDGRQLMRTAGYDTRLREAATRVLRLQWVDMSLWRKVRANNLLGGWWWQIDREMVGTLENRTVGFFSVLQLVIALAVLVMSLGMIFATAGQLGSLVMRLFRLVDPDDLGLDVFTIVGVVAQLVLGGGIAYRATRRASSSINQSLFRWNWFGREWTVRLLPLSRFLIGTLIFLAVIGFIRFIALPQLGTQLETLGGEVEQPIESARDFLDTQTLVDPNTDYAVGLTRLGLRSEQVGDLEGARTYYQRALGTAPNLIVAHYRLAIVDTLFSAADDQRQEMVIRSLDNVIRTLDTYAAALPDQPETIQLADLRLRTPEDVIRYQVLMRIARARAFYNLGETRGALVDLRDAEAIIGATRPGLVDGAVVDQLNSDLFITLENKDSSIPNRVRITELYYLTARINAELAAETDNQTRRDRANIYWDRVLQLADSAIGSERRWLLEAQVENR
jgi:tetratricopeptide (TPR) repeat protein